MKQVFDAVKVDNKNSARDINCYVATHSLVNYAHWDQACAAVRLDYREADHLALRRGTYLIAAGLEGLSLEAGHELRGRFVDLCAPGLPIVTSVKLNPHSRVLLFDVDQARNTFPRVLASACKVLGEARATGKGLSFLAQGPDQTEALIRVGISRSPRSVTIDQQPLDRDHWTWDAASSTVVLRFPNAVQGRRIVLE